MFDASASTGAGPLTYTIEFGDGSSESRMIARHALPMRAGGGYSLQAKLTVTDALGRSASVTREYFAAALEQPSGTFWYHLDGKVKTSLVFDLNGTELSGWYKYGVAPAQRFTGSLTGERTFSLRTDDGQVEFQGAVEWKADPRTFLSSFGVVLRVVGTRGALQGTTLDFSFADPY